MFVIYSNRDLCYIFYISSMLCIQMRYTLPRDWTHELKNLVHSQSAACRRHAYVRWCVFRYTDTHIILNKIALARTHKPLFEKIINICACYAQCVKKTSNFSKIFTLFIIFDMSLRLFTDGRTYIHTNIHLKKQTWTPINISIFFIFSDLETWFWDCSRTDEHTNIHTYT